MDTDVSPYEGADPLDPAESYEEWLTAAEEENP